MLSNGFKINECDKCIYVKNINHECVIVCLYVDDMLIVGINRYIIESTKKMLNYNFDMKYLGLADVILKIRIIRNSKGYVLSQSHYIEKVLRKYGHYESKPAITPFDPNSKLKKNNDEGVSLLIYSRVIGSLMYIMNYTRPNIAYLVGRLARYTINPGHDHWIALVKVLRYLKYKFDYGLTYRRYPPVLEGFSDTNWISNNSETKSTSGYVFTLGYAAVSWKSSK